MSLAAAVRSTLRPVRVGSAIVVLIGVAVTAATVGPLGLVAGATHQLAGPISECYTVTAGPVGGHQPSVTVCRPI